MYQSDNNTILFFNTSTPFPLSIMIQDRRYINVYLGLGSNMGNRAQNLADAIQLIQKEVGKVARRSHIYETEPWGNKEQEMFLNQVVMVNTILDPRTLLQATTKVERLMGRERREKWGPRTIDVDILLYGKRVIRDKGWKSPIPNCTNALLYWLPLWKSPENTNTLFLRNK